MNAAQFCGGGRVAHVDVGVPDINDRQVRIRLQGCGVCASNLPVWEGRPWFKYPMAAGAPGHEGWGVVEAVGREVDELSVGDRVAMLSGNAYAERDVADATAVVKIPRSLATHTFPGEPLGCVLNVFKRSDIQAGQTVAVVGIGFLGALLAGLCHRAGARVIALSRRDCALEMAERFGASAVVRMEEPAKTLQQARKLGAPNGCERVIEVVGTQEALDIASELAGVRASLIIGGYHQDGIRTVNMQRWNWLGLNVINAHERDPAEYVRGMREAADLVASGELDPTPLYTHRFPLEDTEAAFRALAERPKGFFKALIDCE
jgi:threonine dehydrogenase-like Zn-dependent dehydrogenase